MFSAPAALSILAKLDDRLDFRPILERIVLNFKKFSEEFWHYIGLLIEIDLGFISNYLSFLALSIFPVLISLRLAKNNKPFPYWREFREKEDVLEINVMEDTNASIREIEQEFFQKYNISIDAWQERVQSNYLRESDKILDDLPDNKENESVEKVYELYRELFNKREKEREYRASLRPDRIANNTESEIDIDGANANIDRDKFIREAKKKIQYGKKKLKSNLYIKLFISAISCLAIFYVFDIITINLILAILLFCSAGFILYFMYQLAKINLQTIWEGGISVFEYFLFIPLSILIMLFGGLAVFHIVKYVYSINFEVVGIVTIGIVGVASMISFSIVITYRIFTYMYIFLWALGIYIIDFNSDWLIPGVIEWLDEHSVGWPALFV